MAAELGAILLAAGASKRMGKIKQLLPVRDEPAVRFCIRQMLDAGIESIVVVLGAERDKIRPVIADLPVGIALNLRLKSHMAESVSKGLTQMPGSVTGIMVALCDHPLVSAQTYAALAACHYKAPDQILLPVYQDRGGHPTVFPRMLCSAVDRGIALNRVVHANPDRVCRIPINDPGIVQDMDTPADYQRMLSLADRQAQAITG
ncbi:MAG: NTP transferase domain-containing protein [Desulfobacterales bacterium]